MRDGSKGAIMRGAVFDQRIYTPSTFTEAIRGLYDHLGDMQNAARGGGHVDRKFAEKIMLVVSRVNGFRYCLYGHSHAALVSGVSEGELQTLLSGELGAFSKEDAVALNLVSIPTQLHGRGWWMPTACKQRRISLYISA